MGHIELSRSADLVVVAPATADLMAKAANGLAGDLASTTLLATDKPVLMAPAMNVRMWLHAATQRNLARLKADGVGFVGPDEGAMACGEFGPGRMAEPEAIFDAAMAMLGAAPGGGGRLAGKHVLITAGPTAEPIDPVRVITNRSCGKQGYAIAGALAALGARVTLVSGPVAISAPPGVTRVDVETARTDAGRLQGGVARRRRRLRRRRRRLARRRGVRGEDEEEPRRAADHPSGREPGHPGDALGPPRGPPEAGGRVRRRDQRPGGAALARS